MRGGEPMPAQNGERAVVWSITDMPVAGARRIDRPLRRQVRQDRLRHGRTADVSQANHQPKAGDSSLG